jgi:hypothetical protein
LPRKNPSSHSDEQFALFVEKMTSGGEKIDQAQFEEMVRRLVRIDSEAARTAAATTSDSANAASRVNAASRIDASKGRTRKCAAGTSDVLPLIGQLVLQSSDSQGLLVRLLASMLETDGPTATVIFSTLNTTRCRLDLIRRLAPLKVGDRQTLYELNKIIDDFDDACRLRDELIHATYPANDQEERVRSIETARTTLGESHAVGRQRVADILVACNNLRLTGRALEKLIPRIKGKIETYELRATGD